MQEKNEEEYVVIEVRIEGCIYGQGSYITLDRWICEVSSDIQRYVKFGFNRLVFGNLWIGH